VETGAKTRWESWSDEQTLKKDRIFREWTGNGVGWGVRNKKDGSAGTRTQNQLIKRKLILF
jgi:hypothetical protein